MRLVLGSEIAQIDALAMSEYGIQGLQLMENAGRATAAAAVRLLSELGIEPKKEIAIFVGGGNNGGDGLVAARHLHNLGYRVRLYLLAPPEHWQADALVNWQICQKLKLPTAHLDDEGQRKLLKVSLLNCGLIIDGIFGTGFYGQPNALAAELIEQINRSKKPVLAIDVPSGVNASNGEVAGAAVLATATVTFGWAKVGLRLLPGIAQAGRLEIADITLPQELLNKIDSKLWETEEAWLRRWLPSRALDSHKGTYGHTLVIGGGSNMFGAPILAAGGALKTGSGLVTLASAEGVATPLAACFPEAMTLPLPTENGKLGLANYNVLAGAMQQKTVVLGMGLGRKQPTQALILRLLQAPCRGLVVDADALFALAKNPCRFDDREQPVVLTPHPKEMAELLGVSTAEIQANRLQAVAQAAADFGATVVLKGAHTLIAEPREQERIFVNPNGNPGMASGGSGDVLAGVIGSLLAQGLASGPAAAAGVYLQGKAGDLARDHYGEYGMSATNIIECLPQAMLATLQAGSE